MRVANESNLKPIRSSSEAKERGRKGGKASGVSRRKKANFRKTLNMLLTAKIDNEDLKKTWETMGIDATFESAMLMNMVKAALEGNVKAAYFIAQYAGQSGKTDEDEKEQLERTKKLKAETEKLDMGNNDESEGVTIINDAPKPDGKNI